jgi:hypothetical protein
MKMNAAGKKNDPGASKKPHPGNDGQKLFAHMKKKLKDVGKV